MEVADKRLSGEEIELLKLMEGRTLEAIDSVVVARDDLSWNTVRLHFADLHIDINNKLGEIVVDEFGTIDEFGLISVAAAPAERLNLPEVGSDTTTKQINEAIQGVQVVNNIIKVCDGKEAVAVIAYLQAIILTSDMSSICLDKENWFSEMISVRVGRSGEVEVYDDSVNWEDDAEEGDSTHYEFGTELITL